MSRRRTRWLNTWNGSDLHITSDHDSHVFSLDLAHVETLRQHHWSICATSTSGAYAGRYTSGKVVLLHRYVLALHEDLQKEYTVHHKDLNPYNCVIANLEQVPRRVNDGIRTRQSPNGVGVKAHCTGTPWESYQVGVSFSGRRLYSPSFSAGKYGGTDSALHMARICQARYTELYLDVEAGLRQPPEKEELKAIADAIRRGSEHVTST